MDRFDELATFVAIVDTGSLVGAARRLRRSPPAVTRALGALEERVGARLIERTTRRLAPTESGNALAARARSLLADYETTLRGAARNTLSGVLRLTAPVQFGRRHVAPIVSTFLNEHPEVQIELSLNDRNLDLIEEGLDVAVRIGELTQSSLIARQVGSVRRVVVASPAYLARRGTPQVPRELALHDTIFGMARSAAREWRFAAGPASRASVVRLAPRLLVDDVEAQLQAAKAGRGIARPLSYQVKEDLEGGRLIRLLQAFEPPALPVQLVTLGRGPIRPAARAFIDLAARLFRDLHAIH